MTVQVSWRAVQGDVLISVEDAAWLADSLAVLVTAVHHPERLLPEHGALGIAPVVLEVLPELELAWHTAEAQEKALIDSGTLDPDDIPSVDTVEVAGAEIRFTPGSDFGATILLFDIFARAVIGEPKALETAQGTIGYAAAAWVKQLQALTPESEA
jgi:hypothetical protein